mmetsp:Transcript_15442/g.42464  ORF Transcript_15442/g.42464 Transcript_15442/m.42464 type:complete len:277 (-) Transcript_15442:36-866(-)
MAARSLRRPGRHSACLRSRCCAPHAIVLRVAISAVVVRATLELLVSVAFVACRAGLLEQVGSRRPHQCSHWWRGRRASEACPTAQGHASRLPRASFGFDAAEAASYAGPALAAGAALLWIRRAWDKYQEQQRSNDAEAAWKAAFAEREALARIEPREKPWTEAELANYDGSDPDGPILIGVDGFVYNVWKGRNFYSPGCEYHIFAGRDATRLLAKGFLEEESPEEAARQLSLADQASLQSWKFVFQSKYAVVGTMARSGEATDSEAAGVGASRLGT